MRFFQVIFTRRTILPVHASIMGLLFCTAAYSASPDIQADAGLMFDDNVTRAQAGENKLSDQSSSVNLSRPATFPISDHTRALLTGALGAEKFLHHDGLSRLTGSIQGEFQYRSSAEFGTPVLAIFARISAEEFQSDQRDGFRYSTGISLRKTMTDRIRIFGAVSHNKRNGNNAVFDNKDDSARINLDYQIKPSGTLYLGGEYRKGDIVISAPYWNVYGSAYTPDDVFRDWKLYNYRLDGTTVLYKLGYNLALGPRSSIDFSWNRAQSTTSYILLPSWSNCSVSYTTNQYSLAYLIRF
ncbi:MAG: hypothetical protein NUV63_04360 [Gallionella sp.]|nr:hypothetical protein [Gallionella sp.]